MTMPILHYVHDPLCGWCYAAEPLVQAAASAGVPIVMHGGGLWDAPSHVAAEKRHMMRESDGRIARLTGQPFGPAYLDGLLSAPGTVWHSRPTIAAILSAERLEPGLALPMMAAIQHAHYVAGRAVVSGDVLADLAAGLGLPAGPFAALLHELPVDRHIEETRGLMRRLGLGGFPTFLIQRSGELSRLPHEHLYGRPDDFVAAIEEGASQGGARATA